MQREEEVYDSEASLVNMTSSWLIEVYDKIAIKKSHKYK